MSALHAFDLAIDRAKNQTAQRDVPVTRTETAKTCQNSSILDLSNPIGHDVFCDWLSCYQDHFGVDLPIINDGCVVRFETDAIRTSVNTETGEFVPMFDASKAQYTVQKSIVHEGSYDTKISIRCDGRRVELSGNVGRFGRTDNLFGLPVFETVARANEILRALGLPPFSAVSANTVFARSDSFIKSHNVVITRVDLTANFAAGSRDAAFRVLHWMSGQGTARNSGKNPRNYGNGITWNEGSKRHYEKLYFKADELGKHVSQEVKDYCNDNGILRYEVSLKSRELAEHGLQNLTAWSRVSKEGLRMDNVIYGKFAEVLTRNQVTVTEIQDIPGKYGLIAKSYLNGENPYEMTGYADRTKRLWRSQLMKYGIDIAQPIDVTRLTQRVRVIELQPVAAPSWYNRRAA
jgi:Phage replication protein CRI/Phage X family